MTGVLPTPPAPVPFPTPQRSRHVSSDRHYFLATTGNILASFFYGYICTQVIGGWLAARFGGKWVYGVGVTVTTLLTLLTPLAASVSKTTTTPLIILRIVEGLGEVRGGARGTTECRSVSARRLCGMHLVIVAVVSRAGAVDVYRAPLMYYPCAYLLGCDVSCHARHLGAVVTAQGKEQAGVHLIQRYVRDLHTARVGALAAGAGQGVQVCGPR